MEFNEALIEAEFDLEWMCNHRDKIDNPDETIAEQREFIDRLRRRLQWEKFWISVDGSVE